MTNTIHSVRDRAIRVQGVIDFAPATGQVWEINPRTGLLETLAPLTWTGIRTYMFDEGPARVLRRWEQVGSSGHMATLKSLVVTQGHPMKRGQPVNVTRDNARGLQVGHTGDEIDARDVHGFTVPYSRVVITSPATTQLIQGTPAEPGLTQTSLGYVAMLDDAGGMWDGPAGRVPFDIEHVLDPEDPRVLSLVAETANDKTPFLAESLGANHFAGALLRGMGGELSELVAPTRDEAPAPTGRRNRVFTYRDAAGTQPTEATQKIPMTSRKIILTVDGLDGVVRRSVTVNDLDPELAGEIEDFMREVNASTSALLAKIGEMKMAEQEQSVATEQAVAGAEQAVAAQGAAEVVQAEQAVATEELRDSLKTATSKIADLETELVPHRAAGLDAMRETAARVHDADYSALTTEAEIKAAAVKGKTGAHAESPAIVITALYDSFVKALGKPGDARNTMPGAIPKRWDLSKQPRTTRDEAPVTIGQATLAKINNRAPARRET